MRIALLSCFHPYRGGIAQFNANLFHELGREHDVRAFNFSRQYPDFLFPGKTQLVAEDDEAVPVESTALLDTADPFSWIRTARTIRKWNPDVLIVRYWMPYFGPSLGYVCRHMKTGCKVIGILDNVLPHERHFFDKPFTRYFLSGLSASVTLCKEVETDLHALRPDAVNTVIPHPIYNHFGERMARETAEKELGLASGMKNILFFGLIRDYKGLDILLEAFDRLNPEYQLIIAGEPYGSFEKYQRHIDSSPCAERIHVFPQYIRDSEVRKYFSAADVTVLPYRSATQSGIGSISNHFEVPMIVTDVGGLKETIGDKGTGIVCKDSTPECIAGQIENFFKSPGLREACVTNIRRENRNLSWSGFCKNLTSFIEKLES